MSADERPVNLKAVANLPSDAPVVMINLLKFNDGPGVASYLQYSREVQPHLERVGGKVRYAGASPVNVIGDGERPWWDAILIVEFARELQEEGMSSAQAAVEATRRRLRPIIMTSLAFILGVVPLLQASGAGSASQRALGTVVFGGMLASTLFAIPFVPVFYILMHRLGDRLRSGGRIVLPEALRRRRG